mmetsp:Transcript_7466/g.24588  ORF Transcript_7466/g.24588 Transcript_7466/m.24588 type:complete len:205 (-) Transcript_7466:279-893(-)
MDAPRLVDGPYLPYERLQESDLNVSSLNEAFGTSVGGQPLWTERQRPTMQEELAAQFSESSSGGACVIGRRNSEEGSEASSSGDDQTLGVVQGFSVLHQILKTLPRSDLQEQCRIEGLKVHGSKDALVVRLLDPVNPEHKAWGNSHDLWAELGEEYLLMRLTRPELETRCRQLGLKVTGPKEVLISRLQDPQNPENRSPWGVRW